MKKNKFPKSIPLKGRARICFEMLVNQKIKGKIVVDIGSSFGWLEKKALRFKPKRIIGVEPNIDAINFAKKYIFGAEFIAGDALNSNIESNFADVVTLYDVIEHVEKGSELKVLREMSRIIKKNGVLILSTPHDNFLSKIMDLAWYFGHRHYSEKKIFKLLNKSSFKIVKIRKRGDFFSSFYLAWFYIMRKIFGVSQPRNKLLEKLDDAGYDKGTLTDLFLVARKR